MPIGLEKTHPKQAKCFYEKKHKMAQTFILHYKIWAVVKDRKYVLVHAVKSIIANLERSVFKILALHCYTKSSFSRQILQVMPPFVQT